MACACKVNQHIDYLHRKYGNKTPQSKKTNIRFKIKDFFSNLLVRVIMLLFLPVASLHIFFISIFKKNKTINIAALFHIRNGREKQNIQN